MSPIRVSQSRHPDCFRIASITRIRALLVAPLLAGALLLITSLTALADGGPHVRDLNSGSSTLTADSCAGCHRAHTAQGRFLIQSADEEALCLSCHGAAALGATTDVMTGLQYALRGPGGVGGPTLGALRGGGFDQARLDPLNAARRSYTLGGSIEFLAKVPVGPATDVTSAHLDLDDGEGVVTSGVAWGNGDASIGSGVGPVVDLTCTTCHNPHGNGAYRILNPIPAPIATSGFFTPVAGPGILVTDAPRINPATGQADTRNYTILQVRGTPGIDISYLLYAPQVQAAASAGSFRMVAGIASSNASTNAITTTSPHGFSAGNSVTIAGHDAVPDINGTRTIAAVSATTFTLFASGSSGPVLDITTGGTGVGTVTRNTGALAGDYGPLGGDYFHRFVPWNATSQATRSPDAPNGRPTTFTNQMNDWCAACHTRYQASDPFTPRLDLLGNPDPIFTYQHQTEPLSDGASCLTCHVSHGSNAPMDGFAATQPYPDGSLKYELDLTTVVPDSRLLKFANRGTCQACHDPTFSITTPGAYTGPTPTPGVP